MLQTGLLNLAPFDPLGLRNDRNRQAEVSPYTQRLTNSPNPSSAYCGKLLCAAAKLVQHPGCFHVLFGLALHKLLLHTRSMIYEVPHTDWSSLLS